MRVTHVFKTKGVPKYTYVSSTDGKYENDLGDFIESSGTLCLVTGPSKTGKTTLVSRVAESLKLYPIRVRCIETLTPEEFWRQALEQVNFSIPEKSRAVFYLKDSGSLQLPTMRLSASE